MADSPFLPGTHIQYAWDSTSLSWLKECPRKYYYSMICGYRANGDQVHLKFGQLYHKGLENFDKYKIVEGLSHDDALAKVVHELLIATWEDGKPWDSGHNLKTRETLIRSVIWYVEHFKEDAAETVVLANGKPAVELSFRLELDWGPSIDKIEPPYTGTRQPYLLCGHLDRVVNFLGYPYVMDRKTASTTITSAYFDQYDPDNQMTLYTFASKVIYNTPVRGVIIDAMQIAVGFSRPARGTTMRSEAQLEEWLADTRYWFRQAEEYAIAGYWPMNDKSCHKYGGCIFRKVCSKSPDVRQNYLESNFVKQPWNPLESR